MFCFTPQKINRKQYSVRDQVNVLFHTAENQQ